MKNMYYCLIAGVIVLAGCTGKALSNVPKQPLPPSLGLSIAIVYDTSGSMGDKVRDAQGNKAPKYAIANRAFKSAIDHIQNYIDAAPSGETRDVMISLITFNNGRVVTSIRPEKFNKKRLQSWLDNFPAIETKTSFVITSMIIGSGCHPYTTASPIT